RDIPALTYSNSDQAAAGRYGDSVVVGQCRVWSFWLIAGAIVLSGHSTFPRVFLGSLFLLLGKSEVASPCGTGLDCPGDSIRNSVGGDPNPSNAGAHSIFGPTRGA